MRHSARKALAVLATSGLFAVWWMTDRPTFEDLGIYVESIRAMVGRPAAMEPSCRRDRLGSRHPGRRPRRGRHPQPSAGGTAELAVVAARTSRRHGGEPTRARRTPLRPAESDRRPSGPPCPVADVPIRHPGGSGCRARAHPGGGSRSSRSRRSACSPRLRPRGCPPSRTPVGPRSGGRASGSGTCHRSRTARRWGSPRETSPVLPRWSSGQRSCRCAWQTSRGARTWCDRARSTCGRAWSRGISWRSSPDL